MLIIFFIFCNLLLLLFGRIEATNSKSVVYPYKSARIRRPIRPVNIPHSKETASTVVTEETQKTTFGELLKSKDSDSTSISIFSTNSSGPVYSDTFTKMGRRAHWIDVSSDEETTVIIRKSLIVVKEETHKTSIVSNSTHRHWKTTSTSVEAMLSTTWKTTESTEKETVEENQTTETMDHTQHVTNISVITEPEHFSATMTTNYVFPKELHQPFVPTVPPMWEAAESMELTINKHNQSEMEAIENKLHTTKQYHSKENTEKVYPQELIDDMYDRRQVEDTENEGANQLTIKTLMKGTANDLRAVSKEVIIRYLWVIQRLELPMTKKLVVWEILKDNKPVGTLKRSLFESAGSLVLSMPESDLYNVNVSDWDIVDFFGSFHGLSRRQTGVLGFALRKVHGDKIIQVPENINRIKGLICGFSLHDLKSIDDMEFTQIGPEVFNNIGACTLLQKKLLLNVAMRVTVYGPPQVWNCDNTEKMGLLVSAIDEDNVPRINPPAIEGISPDTLRAMEPRQLKRFTKEQVEYMSDVTLTQYRKIMGVPSNVPGNTNVSKLLNFYSTFYSLSFFMIKTLYC